VRMDQGDLQHWTDLRFAQPHPVGGPVRQRHRALTSWFVHTSSRPAPTREPRDLPSPWSIADASAGVSR
jgi:hypothetical protein